MRPMPENARSGAPGVEEALLRRLEWTVLRRLDGLLQGDYRTMLRGAGIDLADLREYQHHDDVRHIDWNVTARLQTPYVRQFTEDRELNAWFLLDLSGSVDFGSGERTKLSVSGAFVTLLARVLTRHGNRVGAVFYGTQVEGVLPPRNSRMHVLGLLRRMRERPRADAAGGEGTALADLLKRADGVMKRRSLVLVVSDFISQPGWEDALARLGQRHEVVAVRLYDPLEMDLPEIGLVTVEDAETGEQLFVDTSDPAFRARYAAEASAREADAARRAVRSRRRHARTVDRRRPARSHAALCRAAPPAQPHQAAAPPGLRSCTRNPFPEPCNDLPVAQPVVADAAAAGAGGAVPLAAARKRRRNTVRLASLGVAKAALGKGPGWRRHVPPLLLLLAIATLLVAIARPLTVLTLAARAAHDHPGDGRVGQHARRRRAAEPAGRRAGSGQGLRQRSAARGARRRRVVRRHRRGGAGADDQPRRRDRRHRPLPAAARHRHRQRHRAVAGDAVPRRRHRDPARHRPAQHARRRSADEKPKKEFTPVQPGSYTSAAIIMLTDGQRTTGPDPMDAAKMAAERGVRVYTVGIGTTHGETIGFEGWSMRVRLDEETLKNIAAVTQGEYFYAGTAEDLKKVYESLSSQLVVERKETEITSLFAAARRAAGAARRRAVGVVVRPRGLTTTPYALRAPPQRGTASGPAVPDPRRLARSTRTSAVEGLDLSLQPDQQRPALAVERLARRHLHPAFADAVLLDVGAFVVVEADADVVLEHRGHVMRAARVGTRAGRAAADVRSRSSWHGIVRWRRADSRSARARLRLRPRPHRTSSTSLGCHCRAKKGSSGLYRRKAGMKLLPGTVWIQLPRFTPTGCRAPK